ncbi:mitogen-activated protein kinase kinase kinase [Achlya hypogyna]|uniref:Mitogen-activated protein kinase kinase kinase n=1 Tax=Achlya hypogyna TaxID=1202772 RepID=A0A1V9YP03_ACHHY|nr:mitogen-activated protein kinase kinase kinase [Achlya hypogyna]
MNSPATRRLRRHSWVWQRGKLVGHGRYGKVYAGILLTSATMVAVKQLRVLGLGDDDASSEEVALAKIEQEVTIGQSLCHPHVVRYLGAQRDGGIYNLFMEYLPMGSVRSLLQTFGPLDESIICVYISQLLRGLLYLHAAGIAHRDIKCANLLLSDSGCLKIADFGTAKATVFDAKAPSPDESNDELFATVGSVRNGIGSPFWMSPEIIRAELGADAWTKSDVWSVGCCVIEMATGEPPWNNFSNPLTAMFHIASETSTPALPSHLSPEAQAFVSACLVKDPAQRPTAAWLLQHPFFQPLPRSSSHFGWFPKDTPVPPSASEGDWYVYYDFRTDDYEYAYYVGGDGGYWVYRATGDWDWLPYASPIVIEIALWWLHAVRGFPEYLDAVVDADPFASVYTVTTPMPYASTLELSVEPPTPQPPSTYVRVLADYETTTEGELSLVEHDVLLVEAMEDNGWWLGAKADDPSQTGWFPCTYVEWIAVPAVVGVVRVLTPTDDSSAPLATAGDMVIVTDVADDQWVSGCTLDNDAPTGWLPVASVEWLPRVKCQWAYEATHEAELSLTPGDEIFIVGYDGSESVWWEGIVPTTRRRGWFPSSHVVGDDARADDIASDDADDVHVVDSDLFAL